MQPEAPQPNYDFFLNPQSKPKQRFLSSNSSMKMRIVTVLGGGMVLIIIVIIISSLLSSKPGTAGLLTLAQEQNELVRVAAKAGQQSSQQILAYSKKFGQKLSAKQLMLTRSATTDQQLTSAQAASNYDSVYLQITVTALNQYLQSLKQVYNSTSSKTQRQFLSTDYSAANILLNQAKAEQSLQNS